MGVILEGDTRERLLDAAERLYTEKGSRGMTTRAVAAAAGVSELTLFRQFGSKGGLLQAMAQRLAQVPMVDRTVASANTGDLREDLCRIAHGMLTYARPLLPFIQRALAEAAEQPENLALAGARPQAALKRLTAFFAERMEAGQVRCGDPLLMAHAFSAMIISRLIIAPLYTGLITQPDEAIVDTFVRLFIEGVAAAAPGEATAYGNES